MTSSWGSTMAMLHPVGAMGSKAANTSSPSFTKDMRPLWPDAIRSASIFISSCSIRLTDS